ncbi:hypothetical protein ACR6C2_18250 [Streptomyces sp. INA 01156]
MLGPSNRRLHGPDSNGLYTPGTGTSDIDPHRGNPYSAKAQDIADRIAHALREVGEIDERYSRALNKLKAAPGLKVDAKTWADVASDADAVSSAASEYLRDNIPLDKSLPTARSGGTASATRNATSTREGSLSSSATWTAFRPRCATRPTGRTSNSSSHSWRGGPMKRSKTSSTG